ncbi:DedA family protein [Thiohalocapsa marina]|uniref:DedA family protein n=1 Tax=Thiohalocapsa marina TaxID=424902 RepID=UPI001FE5F419|nr:DedA family protein [Thiohalocapsa marina]
MSLLIIAMLGFGVGGIALAQPAGAAAQPPTPLPHGAEQRRSDERAHRLAGAISKDIERVEPYLEHYGYWAVFAAVGIEGVGVPAPGQTLLEAGAVVSAIPGSRLNISMLLFVTILATSLGQTLGYLIGRAGGRAVLDRLPISTHGIDRIERAFNRYGGWFVVFGRFVDGPHQLIGLLSGVLGMSWGRFMLLNVIGAILWASFWALGVYYLDLHLDGLVTALRQLNPWIAGLTLIGLGVLLLALLVALIRGRRRNQRA